MKRKNISNWILVLFCCLCVLSIGCADRMAQQHYKRGNIFWRNGNTPMAIRELKAVLRYKPSSELKEKTLLLMATIASGSTKDNKIALWANQERLKTAKTGEERFEIQKNIAEILAHDFRDYSQAIMTYQQLLSTVPNHPEEPKIRLEIARSYIRMEQYQQAEVELKELYSLFPQSNTAPQARYQIGNIAYLKGEFKRARDIFQKVALEYPDTETSLYATFGIGSCFEEDDDLDNALKTYRSIRSSFPNKTIIEQKIGVLEKRYRARGR